MKKKLTAALLALTLLLTACGTQFNSLLENKSDDKEEVKDEGQVAFISMEEEPVLTYDVPKSSPHIIVDELGYITESTKTAYFFGDELPTEFDITDDETGSVVYTGRLIERGYSELYGFNIAYADFSDFTDEGTYHISAQLLGSSYSFRIASDLYGDIFKEACKTYYYNRCSMTLTAEYAGANAHNACHTDNAVLREDMTVSLDVTGGWHQDGTGSKDVVRQATGLTNMLLSYEIFGEAFRDNADIPESGNGIPDILDEAKYETDFLLKLQNQSTGAIYSAVTVAADTGGKNQTIYVEAPTGEASYAFAAVMAKFSFLYQDFDRNYATQCLRAADRAWEYAERNFKPLDGGTTDISPWKLFAATELYRASAHRGCESFLNAYFANPPYFPNGMDEISFYGCVTYLNTKQRVNTDYCEEIIKVIMKRAEEISSESRNSAFSVPGNKEQSNNAELLQNMMFMTLVDHIIANHEYDTVIENHLHYFLGRNAMSIVYLDNVGTYSYKEIYEGLGLMKQFDADSMLIFMLSKIISRDGFEG